MMELCLFSRDLRLGPLPPVLTALQNLVHHLDMAISVLLSIYFR
jgi:hypothetical protein